MLLKINDKEYGLKWGMLAFENLEDELDKSGAEIIGIIIDEISRGRDKTLRKLAYEAIKLWCRNAQIPCTLTEYDFADWLDKEEQGSESVKFILDSFHESWFQGKQISQWIDDIINLFIQSNQEQEANTKVTTKKKSTPVRKSSKTATNGASRAKTTKS